MEAIIQIFLLLTLAAMSVAIFFVMLIICFAAGRLLIEMVRFICSGEWKEYDGN